MGKYRELLFNTLIFTISDFSSKILVFFMLPIYTSAMSTGDYGAGDVINSTVGLLIPLFTLSIANGTLRFAMDRKNDIRQVFSFSLKVILVGFILLVICFPLLMKIDIINKYLLFFFLSYLTSSLHNFFNQFARAIGKIKLVGVCGIIGTVVLVCSNLLLLVWLHWGVEGYLISFILSYVVSALILFINGEMYKFLTTTPCDKQLQKDMMSYSIPLAPTSLSWWLNSTANRYIILAFCDVSQVGLFAAATRIPTILTTIQGVFLQAWQLSAFSEYNKDDKERFFQNVYENINLCSLFGCSLLIMATQPIAAILLSKEFFEASKYAPLLVVSSMFGALSGLLGTVFALVDKTKLLFFTVLVGGLVAVGCNFLFVPQFGIMGAAYASIFSSVAIWLSRLMVSQKYIRMVRHPYRDALCYLLLIIQSVCIVNISGAYGVAVAIFFLGIMVLLNIDDINHLYLFLKQGKSKHKLCD